MKKGLRYKASILVFIFPAVFIFTVVVFVPILQTLYHSFTQWDGLTAPQFTALDNYIRLFQDSLFATSVKNGLVFALVLVVFQIGMGTVLALLVSGKRVPGRKILRSSYFLPVVLSVTVVCQLWAAIYNGEHGLINQLFAALGINYRQGWLASPTWAIVCVAMVNAWQNMGYHFMLLFAGIKAIPEEYMEAAQLDGASTLQAHRRVTIPMLKETYKICFVMAITGGLNAFANMFIMTSGGPGTSTYTLTYMMYRSAFRTGQFGYGSAAAMFLVLECLVATIFINKLGAGDEGAQLRRRKSS